MSRKRTTLKSVNKLGSSIASLLMVVSLAGCMHPGQSQVISGPTYDQVWRAAMSVTPRYTRIESIQRKEATIKGTDRITSRSDSRTSWFTFELFRRTISTTTTEVRLSRIDSETTRVDVVVRKYRGTSRKWDITGEQEAVLERRLMEDISSRALGRIGMGHFFVSTNGSEACSGKLGAPNPDRTDGPFATLERAQSAVRELKEQLERQGRRGTITVLVREGVYYLSRTVVLDERNSGSKRNPITFAAYPGEKPVISGGGRIKARWKRYRGKIKMCHIPEAAQGKWAFKQLFVNGKRQIRARYPDFDPKSPARGKWLIVKGKGNDPWRNLSDSEFIYGQENFIKKKWARPREVEIHIYPNYGWYNMLVMLDHIDRESHTVYLQMEDKPQVMDSKIWPMARYYFEDILEELNVPGEWYLDRESGTLYYLPPKGMSLDDALFEAPRLDGLMEVQGVNHLTFRGFVFKHTTYTLKQKSVYQPPVVAVMLSDAEHCTFENNTFCNLGGTAMGITGVSAGNLILYNEIYDVGGTGVDIFGKFNQPAHNLENQPSARLQPHITVVRANHIHHCGVIYKHSIGISMNASHYNTVAQNLIHDTPRFGLAFSVTSSHNTIEYNHIRDVAQETNDAGAIYCWRPGRRNVVRYNLVENAPGCGPLHDAKTPSPIVTPHPHSTGIYLDDATRDARVYCNVVMRPGNTVVKGEGNVIENNVIVNLRREWMRPELQPKVVHQPGITISASSGKHKFLRNIVYSGAPGTAVIHVSPKEPDFECDYNIYYVAGDEEAQRKPLSDWETWRQAGHDTHSLIANPVLVDPANNDYRLGSDSPALSLGFMPIPFERIGLPPGRTVGALNKDELGCKRSHGRE